MTSSTESMNMTWHLRLQEGKAERVALLNRLHNLDLDIARTENTVWSDWDELDEQVDDSSEEDCNLRKRNTKKIGKGLSLKTSKRKINRDYRDKKRTKESRSRKRTNRSPIQGKGERYYFPRLECFDEKIILDSWPSRKQNQLMSDWMEKINKEILEIVSSW
jgi:hypothetical protein